MTALPSLVFTAGLLLVSGLTLFAALAVTRESRRRLDHRVNLVTGTAEPEERQELGREFLLALLPAVENRIFRLFKLGIARQWGMQADGLMLIAVAIAASIAVWLLVHTALGFSDWIAVPAAIGGFVFTPRMLLLRRQRRTEQRFMILFPDAIDMVIRMLRAGLPITAATRTVANEAPEPVNLVFRSIADRVDIGIPFEEALASAGDTVGLPDFRFFSVAVALQRATGGNLAATLEILAEIIRKRRTVRLRAQASTAEVRMSAYILSSLPFLVMAILLLVSPGYLVPLITDPRGNMILGLVVLGLVLAHLSMRRMLRSVTMA